MLRWVWFLVRFTLLTLALACGLALQPAFALDQEFAPDDAPAASIPPLPQRAPQLLPSFANLSQYHQKTDFPTTTEKWIDVDLSEQRVVAYAGQTPVRAFIVSTGLPRTPTVQGNFRIRLKVRSQTMSGGSAEYGYYSLPNVQWVQYFYEEYAFHGAYWHNNFGQPMSHGCVNMTNDDAQWLFDWAGPSYDFQGPVWQRPTTENQGTIVVVHE